MGSEIMAYPRDQGLYIIDTDASNSQIAGVLSQIQDGRECVISYGSRTLNKAEKNYCITDKELLAIRHFTEYYRQYLLGRHFLVRSDYQALTYLLKLKEPKGRIARSDCLVMAMPTHCLDALIPGTVIVKILIIWRP